MEIMLKETLSTAIREKQIKQTDASAIIVDTTVQKKAIAHPTDARLYLKSIHRLIKLARQRNIELRQSYVRVSKKAFCKRRSKSAALLIIFCEK